MGGFFLNMNCNKRSIVLDLKKSADRATLMSLVMTADVFVHSMRPSAAERLGISYQELGKENPRLVYASAGGYRNDSSRRDWPAFDAVIQA
ncbi:CoA transferase, partial [Bradyrhizobium sp.]|uniref:CoA transferase n=1 Tax=Bradyrhizobium sp. TaxID=376 RepID=UPI0025BF8606